MDAYTARCLQVSTAPDSIPMQRRRSTNMMRRQNSVAGADGRSASMRPTHSRSRTAVSAGWPVQADMSAMATYPQTSSTMSSLQPTRFASPSLSAGSTFDAPFQMPPHMTPVTPFTPSEWDAGMPFDAKQLQGLGMDFPDQAFSVSAPDNHEDVIHINPTGMWDMSEDVSPPRRSSTPGSDNSDGTESGVAASNGVFYEGMLNGRDDRRSRSRSVQRSSRSLSRTPAERMASKRVHRRQLSCQPVPHGRGPSVGGYLPTVPPTPAVLPDQMPADALAMDFVSQDFMQTGMHDADMSIESDFQNNFDALMDVPMSISHSAASHADRFADRFTSPPTDGIFWDNHSTYEAHDFMASPSNRSDEHEHHAGCCGGGNGGSVDDAEKPDLFESIRQEPSNPPEEDMHPEDKDMIPQEQEPRFEGDLYTPRWVRGQGNKREGYCGFCTPGRWLVLKNSAFWYDKSFTHGISAATGQPFEAPRDIRRMTGNPDVWEGLCGGCNDWISLTSSKKRGTTWFRHAYKCHTKNKDKKAHQAPPSRQPSPYANMKPVVMQSLPSQSQHLHTLHAPDMFAMNPMGGMHSMDLHPGQPGPFPEMTYLS